MKNLLKNNPYRILGVYSNSTSKEKIANKTKLTSYARVGKACNFSGDHVDILGTIERSTDSILDAERSITLAQEQLKYALFWFIKANSVDEIALSNLENGNLDKALEIFDKKNTFSSLINKAMIYCMQGKYDLAIKFQNEVIKNDSFRQSFIEAIVGSKEKFSAEDIYKILIDELKKHLSIEQIYKVFELDPSNPYFTFIKSLFISEPIELIYSAVSATNSSKGTLDDCNKLVNNTKNNIKFLRSLLGENDSQFNHVCDKVADCLLNCVAKYVEDSNDQKKFEYADNFIEYAKNLAKNYQVVERCDNLSNNLTYKKTIDSIKSEIGILKSLISRFAATDYHTFSEIKDFISDAKPNLNKLKEKDHIGEIGLAISSEIVSLAVNAVVINLNSCTYSDYEIQKNIKNGTLYDSYSNAVSILTSIKNFAMNSRAKQYFDDQCYPIYKTYQEISTITNLNNLGNSSYSSNSGYSGNTTKSGCYIATMVYGDYEHPKVKILRKFRDQFLAKHYLGRQFIKFYYKYSPRVVEKTKHMKLFNKFVRGILNIFVGVLQKWY